MYFYYALPTRLAFFLERVFYPCGDTFVAVRGFLKIRWRHFRAEDLIWEGYQNDGWVGPAIGPLLIGFPLRE